MRRFVNVPKRHRGGTDTHKVELNIKSSDGCHIKASYTITDEQCYQLGAIMAAWADENAKAKKHG